MERHIKIAYALAARPCSRFTYDERLSAAFLGLCRAAMAWKPSRGAFATVAWTACRQHIASQVRSANRRSPATLGNLDWIEDGHSQDREIETRDEARHYLSRFGRLTAGQRHILELYMAGERWTDIAAALGIDRTNVEARRSRAAKRLLGNQ